MSSYTRASFTTAVAVACALELAGSAQAAEWDTGAFVSVSSYVTDNFCLAPDDIESELINTISPGVNLRGRGARGDLSLNGTLEFNDAAQSDIECPLGGGAGQFRNRESVIPSGRFSSNFEAIENWLTLEANAFAGLSPVNPFAAGGSDGLNGRANTNLIYNWGAGARINRSFDQRFSLLARYYYNEQYNSVDRLYGDSAEDSAQFSFRMIPGTSRLTLGVSGRYSEISFDETEINPAFTNTLSSAELRANFFLSEQWSLTGAAGRENNEFLSVNEEIDGDYWDAGIRWTPNSRVAVEVGTGERFFGDTPRASVVYRHKRSRILASYQRTLTFPRNLRTPQRGGIFELGIPELPEAPETEGLPGDPIAGLDSPALIGDSPVLNEAFNLSYAFTGRKMRFGFGVQESQQTRASDLSRGEFRGANVTASRRISPEVTLSGRLSWRESEGDAGEAGLFGQNVEFMAADIAISRPIGRNTRVGLAYRYSDQESDFAQNTFEENRLTLTIRYSFR